MPDEFYYLKRIFYDIFNSKLTIDAKLRFINGLENELEELKNDIKCNPWDYELI